MNQFRLVFFRKGVLCVPQPSVSRDNGCQVLSIKTPTEFRLSETLHYLTRSPKEILYQVVDGMIIRYISLSRRKIWLKVSSEDLGALVVRLPFDASEAELEEVQRFVGEWFDLSRDLVPFYRLAASDEILAPLVRQFYGLRLVRVPDLFEALCWAVMGQQINLEFAYTLKRQFVQAYGSCEMLDGETHWMFPDPGPIARLDIADLKRLQLTQRKSEYIIGIARAIDSGQLSKTHLLALGEAEARQQLCQVRGVGDWTANYVAMRCLGHMSAFPVGDVGLQNAVKQIRGMERKPTPQELLKFGREWGEWKAYATFYLWRSLLGALA